MYILLHQNGRLKNNPMQRVPFPYMGKDPTKNFKRPGHSTRALGVSVRV